MGFWQIALRDYEVSVRCDICKQNVPNCPEFIQPIILCHVHDFQLFGSGVRDHLVFLFVQ